MKPLRLGLIGCGWIAPTHLHAWEKVKGAEVVALCDIFEPALHDLGDKFGIHRLYTNYQEMFDKERLDIADVATPLRSHYEIATAAARKGLHVLLQKPMSESLVKAGRIVQACNKAKVKLMVHQNFRFQAFPLYMKQMMQKGQLGDVFYARIFHRLPAVVPGADGKAFVLETQPYFAREEKMVLLHMMIHHLDTARFLFGEPHHIYADLQRFGTKTRGEDHALVILNFAEMVCVVEESWVTRGGEQIGFRIEGEKGSVEVVNESLRFCKADGTAVEKHLAEIQPEATMSSLDQFSFLKVQQEFVDCIRKDRVPSTSGADNLKTLQLVFKAYESAERGKSIAIY